MLETDKIWSLIRACGSEQGYEIFDFDFYLGSYIFK